jgi:hypothetical protein
VGITAARVEGSGDQESHTSTILLDGGSDGALLEGDRDARDSVTPVSSHPDHQPPHKPGLSEGATDGNVTSLKTENETDETVLR